FNPNRQASENFYCDICKVGCSTSENYTTHLGGKAHKKKASKPMPSVPSSGKIYQCIICDVLCTGKDAFDAHVIGAKHKRL
ncbi:hypothetical protein, partial [Salmonella sp. s51228]|uniref:hypothetical protein n=1 Tax=Salmonella sp. s51228 TaxID=3159652 RepID=UPI0039811876